MSPVLRDHVGQHRMHGIDDALEIHVYAFMGGLEIQGYQVGGGHYPGIINQNVDAAVVAGDGCGNILQTFTVGNVRHVAFGPAAGGGNFLHQLPQPLLAPRQQEQSLAARGQPQGRGAADAAAGPGDDNVLLSHGSRGLYR